MSEPVYFSYGIGGNQCMYKNGEAPFGEVDGLGDLMK